MKSQIVSASHTTHFARVAKLTILALLLSLAAPIPSAQSVDPVATKTFTVRGADNSLLSGAQIRFYWNDPVTGVQTIGSSATTNSSGVAVLTAPLNVPNLTYTVFPAVTDKVNALQEDVRITSTSDGTVSVKLSQATIFINVQKSDGSNVTGGAVLRFPKNSTETFNRDTLQSSNSGIASIIRSGSVGVRIAPDLVASSDYVMQILQYTDNYQPGQFSWQFGLKASGTSGSQSHTVYSSVAFSGSPLVPVDGAFVLRYSSANIIGTLKNSDGSTFVMAEGMTLTTQLSAYPPVTSATFPPLGSSDFTNYLKAPNGNWFARGLGPAGKYQLTFVFGGSSTIPSFSTFIWKNSAGGWSLNEAGPFNGDVTTPATIEVLRPATSPNFSILVKKKELDVELPSWVQVESKSGGSYSIVTNTRLLNGKFSGILPDGEYRLTISPSDQSYSYKQFTILVASNAITSFKDSFNNDVVPASGIYTLQIAGPNISGTFKDSSGNDLVFGQNQSIDLSIQKMINGNWQWTNNGSYQTSANWKMNIDDVGQFRLVARPNGFSGISESYSSAFFVVAGNPKKLSTVDEATASAGSVTALTGLNISMLTSNLKMTISDPRDNSLLKYGWVSIQKKLSNGDQIWVGNADIRSSAPGLAEIRLEDGNYKLEINPQFNGVLISGLARRYYDAVVSGSGATVTVTRTDGSSITADSTGRFALAASKANILGRITDQSGNALKGSNDKWVSINVQKYNESRKDFDWTSNWANTDQNGDFSITVTDSGKYRLRIQPTGFDGASTFYSQEFTLVTGQEEIKFGEMKSPDATLKGFVYAPGSSTGVRDARVRFVNSATGQELWQYEAFASSTGSWSVNLPAGTYSVYAAAPYGNSVYGNSDLVGSVSVNSSGVATLSGNAASGRTSSTFNLSLKSPTWSGVVKNPAGSSPVPYARVCLSNVDKWYCADANDQGQWALSAPSGFSAFAPGAFVEIGDWRGRTYPLRRFADASAALGGLTSQSVVLNFQQANVSISVTGTGGVPVPNVWVSLVRPNQGWLTGNQTNASGIAIMNVTDLTKALEVRVETGGNSQWAGVYGTTTKNFTANEVSTNKSANSDVFTTSIQLAAPNLTGLVREPNATWSNGAPIFNAWIELFDSAYQFISGTSSGSDGKFHLNVPKPDSGISEYTMVVNPSWNSTTSYSKKSYTVLIDSNNAVTVKVKSSQSTVTPVSAIFPLDLLSPNVSGTVVDNNNVGQPNSWVVAIDSQTKEYLWQLGSNTKSAGNFGMALENGTYEIDANVPGNVVGLARPARCPITITGGVISSPVSSCVIETNGQKTIKLAMRSPNVNFTIKTSGTPSVAIPGANVSLRVGNWSTNAQSNQNGTVSFFIDPSEIKSISKLSGTKDIQVWVDPPWGTSGMVRWNCNSGDNVELCKDLVDVNLDVDTYPTITKDVIAPGPDVKLLVKNPLTNLSVGANAWVSILYYDTASPQNGVRWLAGSNTDTDGYAAFKIDTITATTRFKVEVNPPWNQRVAFAQKTYDKNGAGYTEADLEAANLSFFVGTPNAVVTVKVPTSPAQDNKWGWIGVEEVNSSNNFVGWVGGFGLNDTGTAAITLDTSKRYRIIGYPASGRVGTPTSCYISTSGSSDNVSVTRVDGLCGQGAIAPGTNNLTLTLALGNVAGRVMFGSSPVANATIYANYVGATDENDAVVTSTLSDGKFGLELDFSGGKQWIIKVFPFNNPNDASNALANQVLAALSAPNQNLPDIVLVKKTPS